MLDLTKKTKTLRISPLLMCPSAFYHSRGIKKGYASTTTKPTGEATGEYKKLQKNKHTKTQATTRN